MWQVKIRNSAKADLKKLKHSNLKDSFNDIVTQLKEDPYKNNQGFEKLVPPIAKKYSRRLNIQQKQDCKYLVYMESLRIENSHNCYKSITALLKSRVVFLK